ncbi:retrovirus-related pol polyprotein from transposon TNT 1-94 [Tanacetum coccineum]
MTHPHPTRRFVPQAVLTSSGKINTASASVNTAIRPVNTTVSKPTVNHPRPISNAYKKGYSQGNPQQKEYKEKGVIDSGCSRHMTGNKCYHTEYENYDGGFVSFGDGKGRISRKGKIKTGTLDFDIVKSCLESSKNDNISSVDLKGVLFLLKAKAVNTACYVLNRVLVIKPHNKTPYELIRGRTPLIDFMKCFGCLVTILNTRDHLGKFDGKADEGFFVGYSVVSKAMRVFNKRTRIVEETLNIRFLENTPNVTENGPDWLFDVYFLTISMNYVPIVAGNQTNGIAGTRDNIIVGQAEKKTKPEQEYILIPFCTTDPLISQGPKDSEDDFERLLQQEKQTVHPNNTNSINTVSTPVSAAGPSFTNDDPSSLVNAAEASNAFEEHLFERFSPFKNAFTLPPISNVTPMDDTGIFGNAYDDEDMGKQVDPNNLETTMNVSPIPTTRIDKDHPKD